MLEYFRPIGGANARVLAARCRWVTALLLGTACYCGTVSLAATTQANIVAAVASVARPPQDIALDADRMPAAVLAFAGVKPGEKLVELLPGAGYYTRILSKAVGPKGKVYAFAPGIMMRMPPGGAPPEGAPPAAMPRNAGFPAMANPVADVYRLSHADDFTNLTAIWGVNASAYGGYIGLPEQVDLAWTADIYHDFHTKSFGGMTTDAVNSAIYRDLNPGGSYIVEEQTGVIDPAQIKQEVTAAGFVFVGEDDLGGASGRYVLRFEKPADAPRNDRHDLEKEMTIYFGNTFAAGGSPKSGGMIFYHADHSYQEFNGSRMTNGRWYVDADGNNCMVHQTERAGGEGTSACRPVVKIEKIGEIAQQNVDNGTTPVMLLKGYHYPDLSAQQPQP